MYATVTIISLFHEALSLLCIVFWRTYLGSEINSSFSVVVARQEPMMNLESINKGYLGIGWITPKFSSTQTQFLCQFYELRKLNSHTGVERYGFVAWFGQYTDITFLVSLFGFTQPIYLPTATVIARHRRAYCIDRPLPYDNTSYSCNSNKTSSKSKSNLTWPKPN